MIDEKLNSLGMIENTKDVSHGNLKSGATNLLTPNDDGFNDRWIVKDTDQYPENEVSVMDRSGKVVFSRKGYSNDWTGYRWGYRALLFPIPLQSIDVNPALEQNPGYE